MVAKFSDKILLGGAILLMAGAAAFVWMQEQKFTPVLSKPVVTAPLVPYTSQSKDVVKVPTETWQDPPAQSGGKDWIYEVFTSARIYYLPGPPASFEVTPPIRIIPPQPPFGVELIAAKDDPFRLQLSGILGDKGVFTDSDVLSPDSGNTFLARGADDLSAIAVKELADLHLQLRSFEIKPMQLADPQEGNLPVLTGVAVVFDTVANKEITLTTQTRLMNGKPFAFLKSVNGTALKPMKAGETFSLPDGRKYLIDSVNVTPLQTVVITKLEDSDPGFVASNPKNFQVSLSPPKPGRHMETPAPTGNSAPHPSSTTSKPSSN